VQFFKGINTLTPIIDKANDTRYESLRDLCEAHNDLEEGLRPSTLDPKHV